MTTILHIQTSSNMHNSVTRQIGPQVINKLKAINPGAMVITKDLAKTPLPHISPEFINAMFSGNDADLVQSNQQIDELKASDIVVIEAPMYNFGIPSVLKTWIDHIVISGKTFRYTEQGPKGLLEDKKAILVLGSGGVYSEGPLAVLDHQETYLRHILGFIGFTNIETIRIEGVSMGPEIVASALEKVKAKIDTLQ